MGNLCRKNTAGTTKERNDLSNYNKTHSAVTSQLLKLKEISKDIDSIEPDKNKSYFDSRVVEFNGILVSFNNERINLDLCYNAVSDKSNIKIEYEKIESDYASIKKWIFDNDEKLSQHRIE